MLTKMEVRNSAAALLTLPFMDISGGYVLKNIDGLDPVKATIVTSSYATRDGVEYETAHRDARNLIVHLGIEPDFAATDVPTLRNALSKWFMTKRKVELPARLLRVAAPAMTTAFGRMAAAITGRAVASTLCTGQEGCEYQRCDEGGFFHACVWCSGTELFILRSKI